MSGLIRKQVLLLVVLALVLWGLSAGALAHGNEEHGEMEIPSEYMGKENPLATSDVGNVSTYMLGYQLYRSRCAGCHGVNGDRNPEVDFTDREFMAEMDDTYLFAQISDGVKDTFMRPFKNVFSEEEIWALVNFIRGFSAPQDETGKQKASIHLQVPSRAVAGDPVKMSVSVRDGRGEPLKRMPVSIYLDSAFFIKDKVSLGVVRTGDDGLATMEYVPRETGNLWLEARFPRTPRYAASNATSALSVEPAGPLYSPHYGGKLSWRMPAVIGILVVVVWGTYLYSLWLTYRIGRSPLIAGAVVVALGLASLLLAIIFTSPDTHLHLGRG